MGLIDCEVLFDLASRQRIYKALPKYPAVERDLAIVVPDKVSHRDILEEIRLRSGDMLESVDLFDVYRGDQISADSKSMAYSLRFRSDEGTLTDAEVSSIQDEVLRGLVERCGAELRS